MFLLAMPDVGLDSHGRSWGNHNYNIYVFQVKGISICLGIYIMRFSINGYEWM